MKGALREIVCSVSDFQMRTQSSTLSNLLKVTQLVTCGIEARSQVFLNQDVRRNMKIKNSEVLQEHSQFKEENKINTHETTRTYKWQGLKIKGEGVLTEFPLKFLINFKAHGF